MKELLLFVTLIVFSATHSQNSKLIASCCDAKPAKSFGRCSGDAYCTACSNCKYCKHCSKEGGSCGVCVTYTAPVKKRTVNKKKKSVRASNYYVDGQILEVISETLNLREGAGTNYDIVETLNQGEILTFISKEGDWLYVRVYGSNEMGYINSKYVK